MQALYISPMIFFHSGQWGNYYYYYYQQQSVKLDLEICDDTKLFAKVCCVANSKALQNDVDALCDRLVSGRMSST